MTTSLLAWAYIGTAHARNVLTKVQEVVAQRLQMGTEGTELCLYVSLSRWIGYTHTAGTAHDLRAT